MLIGVQFAVSITLIISSLFIKLQHDYMFRHDMGFNKDLLLTGVVPSRIGYRFSDREAFASELKKNPQIVDVAYANGQMVSVGRMGWGRDFNNEEIHFSCYPVSYNFLKFMGIDIVEGEDFSKVAENDSLGTFIFNEVAKNKFGLTLEDRIVGHNKETKIVGFCKDFNFKPLQYDNEPFAFYVFGPDSWKSLDNLYVRIAPVSYVIIDRWLGKFAYRTPMRWWVFALSLAIVLVITISIVLIRCWKSANANPVEALKGE